MHVYGSQYSSPLLHLLQQGTVQTFVGDSWWGKADCKHQGSLVFLSYKYLQREEEKALSSNYFNVHIYSFGSFPFEVLAVNNIMGISTVRFFFLENT